MGQDLRTGLRRLARSPGFTLLAAGILALGLSTSTAVFTYVNAYRRTLPGVNAQNLHQIWFATEQDPWGALSIPDYEDLVARGGSEFSVGGVGQGSFGATVRRDREVEVAFGESVTGTFFSVAGVQMAVGRGIAPEDDLPGATPVTVLAYEYWVSRYGADPNLPGQIILLNNEPYTIVGVAGPEFLGSSAAARPQFWIPVEQWLRVYRPGLGLTENRELGTVLPYVRVTGGVPVARTEQTLEALAGSLDSEAPLADRTRRFVLQPATWISPAARDGEAATTRIMLAAAGFLLLLACANAANLVLSAGVRRRAEMAIRGALGATRGQLIRQLLTESLLLSVPAGVIAVALAGPLAGRLSSYFARPSVWGTNVPRDIVVDPGVLLFAFAAAVLTGVATGLVPAWQASSGSPAEALGTRGTGAEGSANRRRWLPGGRDLLVSAQIAISVVLIFVAALVLRTLDTARHVDIGFDTQQTLSSYVSTSSMGVPIDARHAFYGDLIRRFEALPWVEAATVAENAPLSGHPRQDFPRQDGGDPMRATVARVWPGYFEALEMGLLAGRTFLPTDTTDTPPVVVVNESLARLVAPNGDAVGRPLVWPGGDDQPDVAYEIVGVIRDARQVTLLDPPGPVAYLSLAQVYSRPGNAVLLKVRGDPAAAVEMMRRELRAVDTRLAIVNILPYRDVVRGALYTQRMNAELFTVIAALGLLLSAAGIFAVVVLAVAGRRREIGIRVAVGANSIAIMKSVAGPIAGSVIVGLGVGLAGAFGATRAVESLLWGVTPADPMALGVGGGVLLMVITLAVGVPLRRVLEVDPVASLRVE